MQRIPFYLAILVLFGGPSIAGSLDPGRDTHNYALLVGSNRAGKNQEELKFAHADAARLAGVLVDVAGYNRQDIATLYDPGAAQIGATIAELGKRLTDHQRKREKTSLVFYYSGHARSHALSLGDEEMPLVELRRLLESLPATVKIIILDACQTGAFSRVKGAGPAVDFSHNSTAMLNVTGMAVMASSTGSELSQESEDLGGSFFTHHLVVGLRGAADIDKDGQVTLSEAYRYAYNQTLVSTSGTAVGKQHVTLETELVGKGEMVLSWPAEASSRLALPASLGADILLYRAKDRSIVAEAHKATGSTMELAFPPDAYEVIVRQGPTVQRCPVRLVANQRIELGMKGCQDLDPQAVVVKHVAPDVPAKDPFRLMPMLEVAVGGLIAPDADAYIDRLEQFRYEHARGDDVVELHYAALVGLHFNRYLSAGILYSALDSAQDNAYRYSEGDLERTFNWRAHRLAAQVRFTLPLVRDRILPFAQLSIGASVAKTKLIEREFTHNIEYSNEEITWGLSLSGGLGVIAMLHRSFGLVLQADYIYANAMKNLYEERHNSGGFAFSGGLRFAL